MTHAYAETYLPDGMRNLGEAMDYAATVRHMDLDDFMALFISSGIADEFGVANPKYIAGLSGTELFLEVLWKSGLPQGDCSSWSAYDCTPEYWCGWVVAYYQWATGRTFAEIHRWLKMRDVLEMYPTLHEASEEKFVDVAEELVARQRQSAQS